MYPVFMNYKLSSQYQFQAKPSQVQNHKDQFASKILTQKTSFQRKRKSSGLMTRPMVTLTKKAIKPELQWTLALL